MKRRTLLGGLPLLSATRALAQPMPLVGPVGVRPTNAGPLFSLNAGPPGVALDISFMTPGTLPTGVTLSRGSTATYVDATGTLQTVSGNTPRWDYNPSTHVLNGLLIEEARTNIVTNSTNFSLWTTSGATLTAGAAAAPDGSVSMTLISETTANTIHYTNVNYTTVASTRYVASVFAKTSGTRYLQMVCDENTNGAYATFDLQAGTVSGPITARGTGVINLATIQPIGNGIYRCSVSATLGSATTGRIALVLSNVPTPGYAPSYAGNASNGVLVWGAQMEQAAFPASYIPTTGATVTRSADVATILSTSIPGRNAAAETWNAEFIVEGTTPSASPRVLGSTSGNAAMLGFYVPNMTLFVFDTASALYTTNALTVGAITKGASTWTSATERVCLNGSPVASGAAATGFSGVTTVKFFGDAGTDNTNGWLRRVRYWPRVLTNTELQQVTT